jgi:protein arginine kinase
MLDYAFDEKLGFLTSDLHHVGTGLEAMLLLHLPASRDAGMLEQMEERARRQRYLFAGARPGAGMPAGGAQGERLTRRARAELEALDDSLCASGGLNEAAGDLFTLVNGRTLGLSEAEIVFHLRHLAEDFLQQEGGARETLTKVTPLGVQDRVGRARGIAGGAFLLGFAEALDLLSSLRLGVAAGHLPQPEIPRLNGLLLRAQRAHLETALGRECDGAGLSAERARLFRSHFGAGPDN